MAKFKFEPSYDVEKYDEDNSKEIEYHFLGSNGFEWKTDADYKKVYDWFLRQDYEFSMHFVPAHAQKEYEIHYGRPLGVNAHWLGSYLPHNKKQSTFTGRKK